MAAADTRRNGDTDTDTAAAPPPWLQRTQEGTVTQIQTRPPLDRRCNYRHSQMAGPTHRGSTQNTRGGTRGDRGAAAANAAGGQRSAVSAGGFGGGTDRPPDAPQPTAAAHHTPHCGG